MSESKGAGTGILKKPTFTKVGQLRPGTSGHTLTLKVLDSKLVQPRGAGAGAGGRGGTRIAECLVGDDTGVLVFSAKNDQVDVMKAGSFVTVRNGRIDMFKGSMRLACDRWGRVEPAESQPVDFPVKLDNNLSLIEFELIRFADDQDHFNHNNNHNNVNANNAANGGVNVNSEGNEKK